MGGVSRHGALPARDIAGHISIWRPRAGNGHDFSRDPIQPYIDGNWVRAAGRHCADNGIERRSLSGSLNRPQPGTWATWKYLFTADEEAGMWAVHLHCKPDWPQGKILINTDAEQDGDIWAWLRRWHLEAKPLVLH